jgi:hypothetical protein
MSQVAQSTMQLEGIHVFIAHERGYFGVCCAKQRILYDISNRGILGKFDYA